MDEDLGTRVQAGGAPPVSKSSGAYAVVNDPGVESMFLDTYVDDSIRWFHVATRQRNTWSECGNFSLGGGNGKIPVWEASPLYKQGIAGLEGAAYEQQLVLLGSCISIMMELDMISSDLVNRMPMFVLHRPKGQVSLSGSPMYVQGRRLRKTAGQLMQRFEGGLRHGGKR